MKDFFLAIALLAVSALVIWLWTKTNRKPKQNDVTEEELLGFLKAMQWCTFGGKECSFAEIYDAMPKFFAHVSVDHLMNVAKLAMARNYAKEIGPANYPSYVLFKEGVDYIAEREKSVSVEKPRSTQMA